MIVADAYNPRDVRDGKTIVVPEYDDVIGFIRFPSELVKGTQEGKLTPSNYNEIREMLISEIMRDPERWITPI